MKFYILVINLCLSSQFLVAQNVFPANGNVGIGTTTPQKKLDVKTNSNDFVSIGNTIGIGEYSGLHFGYSDYSSTNYRKSAIVFERLDAAARGKIHFLNNDGNNFSSATLADSKMVLDYAGNLGLGTVNPAEKFHIAGLSGRMNFRLGRWSCFGESYGAYASIFGNNIKVANQNLNRMEFVEGHRGGGKAIKLQYDEGITFHTYLGTVVAGAEFTGYERMRIDNNGNVGIGTQQITERLTVNGKIRAEEVRVVVDVPADYVFTPEYELMPLDDLLKYVSENKHLPNIPPGKELKKEGWNVGEMNNKLLEKVEELTLYILQLNDRIKELESKKNNKHGKHSSEN